MATTYLGGKVDVSLNNVTIPAQYLSEDGAVTTITEGEREVATMSGTFKQSSGTFEEVMVVFTVVLPSMNYLKNIFPDMYMPSERPTIAGQVTFGGDDCTIRDNTPVVVHYTCDANSDNDVYVPNGAVIATIEMQQNSSDPVTVEITVNAQPDNTGRLIVIGTGSLTQPTLWDAVSETYDPIAS